MTTSTNTITTTKVRTWIRAIMASAVGSLIAFVSVHFGKLDTGTLAFIAPAVTGAYYAAVSWLEKKFPSLGWLLGALPQPKVAPVVPVVPAVPVVGSTAVK
jgi:hypothetical protein